MKLRISILFITLIIWVSSCTVEITNRYGFTFYNQTHLREKWIRCNVSIEWMNLTNSNVFTTKHSLLFKRNRYILIDLIHGK